MDNIIHEKKNIEGIMSRNRRSRRAKSAWIGPECSLEIFLCFKRGWNIAKHINPRIELKHKLRKRFVRWMVVRRSFLLRSHMNDTRDRSVCICFLFTGQAARIYANLLHQPLPVSFRELPPAAFKIQTVDSVHTHTGKSRRLLRRNEPLTTPRSAYSPEWAG